jgi:hypothetical protein
MRILWYVDEIGGGLLMVDCVAKDTAGDLCRVVRLLDLSTCQAVIQSPDRKVDCKISRVLYLIAVILHSHIIMELVHIDSNILQFPRNNFDGRGVLILALALTVK